MLKKFPQYILPLTIVFLLAAPVAQADCSALETALRAAPQQFSSLRGQRDQDFPEHFYTHWSIGGIPSDDCSVEYDEDKQYILNCQTSANSFSQARSRADALASLVERCLASRGGQYVAEQWREHSSERLRGSRHYREFYVATGDAANDIKLIVYASEYTGPRGQRYIYGINVDLQGDER